MYPGWLEATMGGSSEDDLREICWLSSCCESNWAADGTLTLGYALTHPDFCTQGEVRYVKVVAWTAEAGSFWTTTASPSTGPCHLSPLLSEQRESQCLPKTTSILSPCRQTKSVLFGCREWLPLIRRTCWGWRCQLFSYNGKKKIRISNDLLLQNNNKTNQKKKNPYLHRMANEAEGGRFSRTCVFRASAVQQAVKHPPVLAAPVAGPTAEERMGAKLEESSHG